MGRLDGKLALITGGARGMGKSHVRHFVAEGARVVFGDVLDDKGAYVAAELVDASLPLPPPRRHERGRLGGRGPPALEAFGPLDVLVNNAGVRLRPDRRHAARRLPAGARGERGGLLARHEDADRPDDQGGRRLDRQRLLHRGVHRGGRAVRLQREQVRDPRHDQAAAQELGQFGIRVNSVHPGGVLTRMVLDQAKTGRDGDRASSEASRSAGSPSRPRSPAWWPTWPPTSRPTYRQRVRRRRRGPVRAGVLIMDSAEQRGTDDDDTLTLAGKVAVVTGAGNGLGRAESVALARAGALLVLNDLPGDAVAETAGLIARGRRPGAGPRGRHRRVGDRRSGW